MCRWSAIRNKPEFSRESASSKIFRMSMSILPMTAPAASISSSEGTFAGRGSSIRVCSRSVSFAANPGSAAAAARTASAPQATFSNEPRKLSDLRFLLLRSWQKPRFLPAETKLVSEKAPQATFSNELESCVIALARANPHNAKNVRDEYLPVADLSGLRRPDDGLHDLVD